MKNKLIAGIAASAMLIGALVATPAQSQNRDYRWGNDNNRYSPYYGRQVGYPSNGYDQHGHHNKKNNNDAIVAGVAGLIIGGMIVSAAQKQKQPQEPYQTYPEPQSQDSGYASPPVVYCAYVQVKDQYGNVVTDYYGRPHIVQRCRNQ